MDDAELQPWAKSAVCNRGKASGKVVRKDGTSRKHLKSATVNVMHVKLNNGRLGG